MHFRIRKIVPKQVTEYLNIRLFLTDTDHIYLNVKNHYYNILCIDRKCVGENVDGHKNDVRKIQYDILLLLYTAVGR